MNAPTVSEPMTVPSDQPAEAWSQSRAWHRLALAEARAARRQWRAWLCLGVVLLGFLVWVELLVFGLGEARVLFLEMFGHRPLPNLTQSYLWLALVWTTWLRLPTWISLLAFWCWLAWPGGRRQRRRQALADWGRLCLTMSHQPEGASPTPLQQAAILQGLHLPAMRQRVAHLLWPPSPAVSLAAWTEPPPALAQAWHHHRGELLPSQWAACGQQFSQALDQEDYLAEPLLSLLMILGFIMIVLTGFMLLALVMPSYAAEQNSLAG